MNAVLKGQSSAGKNYVLERVLDFFPSGAFYFLTAMSERALAYSEESLEHRFLVIAEAVGAQGDFLSYTIRSLLSEGRLRYETVEKTAEGFKARLIERKGPTGLLMTTTAIHLHPENETRYFSIPISDTPDQTHDVLLKQAQQTNSDSVKEIDFTPWYAFQTWLEEVGHHVFIPYATSLAELLPTTAVRLRRDFPAILHLIKAHAIVYQASRERDEKGRIVATLEDYAMVRNLVGDLVGDAVDATVSPTVRETVEAVQLAIEESDEDFAVTSRIEELVGLHKSTVSRRLRTASAKRYIRNLETQKGKAARWVVGDPIPEDVEILPVPEIVVDAVGRKDDATAEAIEKEGLERECCSVARVARGGNTPSKTPDSEREVFRFKT